MISARVGNPHVRFNEWREARVVRSMSATRWPLSPSALLRMMGARNASACAVFLRHPQRCSSLRCSSEAVGTTCGW